ncbi:DoxX family protein [Sphingobacteriaceae bacterium]|nr:DoxX family protein [Sphingobacteriaceae bacterium]
MTKSTKIISWISALVASIIMLQTLYFKFSAAPESVYIFTQLGLEPYGRIGVGVAELIAAILLLIPSVRFSGALMGIGLMTGALIGHMTKLGIEVMGDGGYLFALCLIVLLACLLCFFLERKQVLPFLKRVFSFR